MLNPQFHQFATSETIPYPPQPNRESQAIQHANSVYRAAIFSGQISKLLAWIARQPDNLIDGSQIRSGQIMVRTKLGVQPVPINHIVGSLGRSHDFSSAFQPLSDANRNRWVNIATLKLLGVDLPPIELIKIRDGYFVNDGHHRISVARALGQEIIDADVTVWHVIGQLAWEKPKVKSPLKESPGLSISQSSGTN
jgi:hypothetical protein